MCLLKVKQVTKNVKFHVAEIPHYITLKLQMHINYKPIVGIYSFNIIFNKCIRVFKQTLINNTVVTCTIKDMSQNNTGITEIT